MTNKVNRELHQLLQLPAMCFKATLELDANKLPQLTTYSHIKALGVDGMQVFELRDITPKAEPAPLDIDKMAADALWRVNDFIDERAHMYKILTIYDFEAAHRSMHARWKQDDIAREIVRPIIIKLLADIAPQLQAFFDSLPLHRAGRAFKPAAWPSPPKTTGQAAWGRG